jgi:hypothetical protein
MNALRQKNQEEQKFHDQDDYFTFLHALKAQAAIFAANSATPLVVSFLMGASKDYLEKYIGDQVRDKLSLNIKLWSYPFYAEKYMWYLSAAYCGLDFLYSYVRIIHDFVNSDDYTFKGSDDVQSIIYDLATKGYHGVIFSALGVGVAGFGGLCGLVSIGISNVNYMTPSFADSLRFQVILENHESLEFFVSYIKEQAFIVAKKYIANEFFFHTINLLTDEKQLSIVKVEPQSEQMVSFMGHEEGNANHLIFELVGNSGHEL